jgi:hypothetical protein
MCIIAAPILEHRSPPQRSCSTDSTPRMPRRASTTQEQEIQETTTTKTVPSRSYSADSTPRMPHRTSAKRRLSHRHPHVNQEDSDERKPAPPARILSRWSSSERLIVDGPPSQPLSCSVKESQHEDVLDRLRFTIGRLQADSDSRWSTSYQAASDTAPSEPLAHRRMIAGSGSASAVKESRKHHVETLYLSAVPRSPPRQRQMVANFA